MHIRGAMTTPYHRLNPARGANDPASSPWSLLGSGSRILALSLAASVSFAAGCLEGPPAERGTTRVCPDAADGDATCFQQCADTEALDCTAADGAGTALMECTKDEMSGEYVMVDGALVPPGDETACVAYLLDAGACDEGDVDLEIQVVGAEEDACIDVNCAVIPPEDCD